MPHESISINLESRSIPECPVLPDALKFMGRALQHQVDVFEAASEHDIILDLAPTGTGKTKAGLSTLLHQPNRHAIYIAPTNALIEQQAKAAEEFIQSSEGALNHVVKAVSAREVRQWSNDRVGFRPGEKIYNLLRNPAIIFPELGGDRPLLLVTNPDIFYYATFFSYNQKDKVNIATSFYTQFATIIFDEFHLYDAKQLVSLLFYLSYLHIFDFFKAGRKVILLTATPEKACDAALGVLESRGVRIKKINGESGSHQIPSQTSVQLTIKSQVERDALLNQIADEVYQRFTQSPDRNGAVILDSKDHVNRLRDLLIQRGLSDHEHFGRIHGSTPQVDRAIAAQRSIILATSTVDVGFNFEREPSPKRQNLDWLIFSARDRAAFWQRIGRVGRVLGKSQTEIPSDVIAYLPEMAWDQGLIELDGKGGRNALQVCLDGMKCMERPFLQIYWQSEALLEVARPLLILEGLMSQLPQADLVPQLFSAIQEVLGGKRDWSYFQRRMQSLEAARLIATSKPKELEGDPLRWVKINKYPIVTLFLKSESPEDWELLKTKQKKLKDFEKLFQDRTDVADRLIRFAKVLNASYAPLFQFRGSLFDNVRIRDPKGLLLDQSDETDLDVIHLLRNYEFLSAGDTIEVIERAQTVYDLSFYLSYDGDMEEFKSRAMNKLTAFSDCRITRNLKGAISPTPLLKELEKHWLAGVIVSTIENQGVIIRLSKQGIASYPIVVDCADRKKEFTIFPGFSGIITAAINGVKIRLMDEEEFWVA